MHSQKNQMLTGMSAPPMDEVICNPKIPLLKTPEVRAKLAMVGSLVVQNAIIEATLIPARPIFRASRIGS
jgi:hypothetical protein